MAEISGGEKLEAYLAELSKKVSTAASVRVGFLEDATYASGESVAAVAATQNFGAPAAGIPPRPFFTNMVRSNRGTWGPALARILKNNGYDAAAAMDLMGQGISGQLRQSIVETMAPPLSPITLMLRKMRDDDPTLVVTGATVGEAARRVRQGETVASGTRAKPLVDTGHMLASIDYEVSDGN